MKKLLYLFWIAVLMGCQKAELVDGDAADGWEGAVDAEFTF